MTKPRQTSVVVLVTLAELAWLAAFGLLIAYRGKVSEVGRLRRELSQIEMAATNVSHILQDRENALRMATNLQARLDLFSRHLGGHTPEDAAGKLKAADEAAAKLRQADENGRALGEELVRERLALAEARNRLRANGESLGEMQRQLQAMPANAQDLARQHKEALHQLELVGTQMAGLSNRLAQLELGEVAIRRELIGLPRTELRRVVFIVDTSSSMRTSPAWQEARSIMRMWVEYLSVEECSLVNFNDGATIFPPEGYQRIRESGGQVLAGQKAALLDAFDRATPGTYSDLLKGLRLAYSRPNPDLIVLLTDGHPHVSTQSDKSFGQAILREVSLHPKVPILAVAVGSYEVEGVGGPAERRNAAISFLKLLARTTKDGGFIGR
jgi:hypothetical protein